MKFIMRDTVLKLPYSKVECSYDNQRVHLFVPELNSSALEGKVQNKEDNSHRKKTITTYDGTNLQFIVSLGFFTITETPLEKRVDKTYYQHLCFGTMITIVHALSLIFCHRLK